jgi:LysR family hydrogen peroxide-inducible transcriptional activator
MRALPSPRQLRYLVTVAETLHFGQAADRCNVTQSTLSAGIRELESLLGVTLIERQSRRRVMMTPVGHEIVARAQRLLLEAETLVDVAAARTKPLAGLLRMGVIPTIGPYLLPAALPALRRQYPDLRLYLHEALTDTLLERLAVGRLDAVLVATPFDLRGMVSLDLGEEDVVAALPADHPLAAHDTVSEADLANETLLMLEDGHCLRDHALSACHLDPGRADTRFQATSVSTLTQMVAAGLGVTLLPRMAVAREVPPKGGVVVRNLAETRPARTLVLAWRPGAARESDFRLLGDLLRQTRAERVRATR